MNIWLVFGHILGAVIWAGGVLFLGVVAAGSRRTVSERERIELFRVLGRGFLGMAAVAALLLGLTGNLLVDRLFGGWNTIAGEAQDLVVAKTALFAAVLAVASLHGLALGPRIRELRLAGLDGELGATEVARLSRLRRLSTLSQILMLAGTIAILGLAADLVS